MYDLIPPEQRRRKKAPLYKSQFPGNLPPTGSTFLTRGTSKPGVCNVGGDLLDPDLVGGGLTMKKSRGAIGVAPDREAKPHPAQFTRKHAREPRLPTPKKFTYSEPRRRDAVPKKTERPVMGLKSEKNFITSNAIENILAKPKRTTREQPDYTKKPDYGRVPQYLRRVQEEIQEEYQYVADLQQAAVEAEREHVRELTAQEKEDILAGLRQRWDDVNKHYQTLRVSSDTPAYYQRKERLEGELRTIEKDIERFSKPKVFVHEDF